MTCDVEQVWKGSVGKDEARKEVKTTPDVGGKSVSEKTQTTHTVGTPLRHQKVNRQNFSSVK